MKEISIYGIRDGGHIHVLRDDMTNLDFYELPAELKPHVEAIIQYFLAYRTEAERNALEAAKLLVKTIPEEQQLNMLSLFPRWSSGILADVGEPYVKDDILYHTLQKHVTGDDRTPETSPTLFRRITPLTNEKPVEEISEFVQPESLETAYKIGDKVRYRGRVYESLINANTYAPDVYADGWKEVTDGFSRH